MALQALAKYATLTYGSNGNSVVTVTAPTGSTQDFVLDTSNRLVLQRAALHELPGLYAVQARGQGCALVQVGTARDPRPHVSPMGCPSPPHPTPGDPALQRAPTTQYGEFRAPRGDRAQDV